MLFVSSRYQLMCHCWEFSPLDRPSFSDIVRHIEHLLEKQSDYIQLEAYDEGVYSVLDPDVLFTERL
jgi:fibroblast growth factor receptor 1